MPGYGPGFREFFFLSMALYHVIKGGIPCIGPDKRAHTHHPEQEHAHKCASFGLRKPRHFSTMSPKECVFGCEGKMTFFQFPKEPSVKGTVDEVCFSGTATELCMCVCLFPEFR